MAGASGWACTEDASVGRANQAVKSGNVSVGRDSRRAQQTLKRRLRVDQGGESGTMRDNN
jgi:hypothetical protein